MAPSYQNLKIAPLLALALVCSGCRGSGDQTWDVLLGAIPQKVSSHNVGETGNYYVLRQTHEALLRQEDGQQYSSRLLAKWSRSLDNRRYGFCLLPGLKFDDKNSFQLRDLTLHLSSVTARFASGYRVHADEGCATVEFSSPRKGFLDFLSRLENAPSVSDENLNSAGLGPFRVKSISKSEVDLERKVPVSGGYNKIAIHEYTGSDDPKLNDTHFEDFNKLSSFDQPEWIKERFQRYYNVELRSVNLVINHPDPVVRRMVHACLDVDAFRRAFAPKRKEFYDIQNILPVGIPGASPGRLTEECPAIRGRMLGGISISLVNQKRDNLEQLKSFSEEFYRKTGIRITLKNMAPQEISGLIKGGQRGHAYNLILLVLDTVTPDYDVFFDYTIGDAATIDNVPPKLTALYRKLKMTESWEERTETAAELAKLLNTESLILSLYQTIVPVYYPPGIKNINVGRGFTEYPEVADFRW